MKGSKSRALAPNVLAARKAEREEQRAIEKKKKMRGKQVDQRKRGAEFRARTSLVPFKGDTDSEEGDTDSEEGASESDDGEGAFETDGEEDEAIETDEDNS